ncbi:uncharacterized protein LOC123410809 [Hordeum vulgare subsp. vulgare]|uniref:uncharacterized protein LOC123410809 n=1 Tax=Hordeum vulgare subsp. vulgare TaxID=112509 RepID=UPI001D1A43DE|nr:uncharacterized protein LOC123410809 [Hordeum vulgare subsp. vulgare]
MGIDETRSWSIEEAKEELACAGNRTRRPGARAAPVSARSRREGRAAHVRPSRPRPRRSLTPEVAAAACCRACVHGPCVLTAAVCYRACVVAAACSRRRHMLSRAHGGRRLRLHAAAIANHEVQCLYQFLHKSLADFFVYMPTRCLMKIQPGYRGRLLLFYAFLCTQ